MNVRELLIEPIAYIAPARALDGLSAADAERRVTGANHSVAEIIVHLAFWQEWMVGRAEGLDAPMAQSAADGWPTVPPGTWLELRDRFLAGLDRAAAIGEPASRLDTLVTPPIEFPPLAHHTLRDVLIHIAAHNAHHLGQVIVLRQLLGRWPPPAGSWTW